MKKIFVLMLTVLMLLLLTACDSGKLPEDDTTPVITDPDTPEVTTPAETTVDHGGDDIGTPFPGWDDYAVIPSAPGASNQ